ncbi:alpha/beta hydrolase [Actinomadura kijaniata]|uniref:Pimeloyl-ACP methyl ester carboxylesterase n=1 Tax=Actinomadura namibiensis TaxID=182080 RepID=A0A7W3LQ85_ACTNM|nr:alpha/beta hydrolase [Actinomadura namibiensis]MBA8952341.1 pimeloyl-ACP methyl ester carboxylesterase [Actinomadura namibiensis]
MREVRTADGRVLAVEEWGTPGGTPVLYLHGTPVGRLARHPDDTVFTSRSIRLITFDRPGLGGSTPRPGRRVVDGADDVAAVADAFGLDRVPVYGVSGGGPHALAFAALRPDRATRVASLAALAPRDADGLDWTAGMMEGNVRTAAVARRTREDMRAHLGADPSAPPRLPETETAVLSRPGVGRMLAAAYADAVRPGLDGWIDDALALFGLPWGFDPAAVTVPTLLWHGALDPVVPVAHARWLAARLPHATVTIDPDAGHAGHFDATPAVLDWLLEKPSA